jgi:hypothetical protein
MNPIRIARLAALALAVAFVGCDNPPAPTPSPAPAPGPGPNPTPAPAPDAKPAETKSAEAKAGKPLDIAGAKLNDDEIKEINKIEPEADRKVALEQKLCPVSGEHLGSMEVPIKLTLKGQTVYICCGGCKKEAEAKPDEALAKLGK